MTDPYLAVHAPRYGLLIEKVRELAPPEPRILDVAPSYEAEQLRRLPAVVDSLGFRDPRFAPAGGERHIDFDLRDAGRHELWPDLADYDVVVCAEVLEHVPVSPVDVLLLLVAAVRPGGWLVLQTPNAARISNRLRLLRGRSPFELPREGGGQPAHFREYTVDELLAAAREAGLEPGGWLTASYFVTGSRGNAVARRLGPLVPRSLRAGITAWFRRPPR
ncbi:MAG TPA: methyltransferase domain-containing protein [Gaiellaceae bacterium]|nr:methyltransferase domain-containing protein [Gaiellaceae bacterium]